MRPAGSQGREAFASALARLAAYRPETPGKPPPYQYQPPGAPGQGAMLEAVAHALEPAPGTIAAAAAAMRSGRLTSLDMVDEALAAVDKFDPELNAVAHLMADAARAEAQARDAEAAAGHWRGPLHGVPITVKDVLDVAGVPTRAGSATYERVPVTDAAAVTRARQGGAVILAKVTTHEFALGVTSPQSRNPHDPGRIPGGSSGGSAIAVSTGMGRASIGTDTRASIRVPAALCGVVGFKATFGAIPTGGVVPLSWTMDHVAAMASTVEDAALLLDALTGGGSLAGWAGADVAGLRVGVPEAAFAGAEPGVEAAVRKALAALGDLGCSVTSSVRPTGDDLDAANAAGLVISRCEAAAFHRALGADRSLYWEEVADQLDAAAAVTAVDYIDAQRLRADLAVGLLGLFEDHDVLAMPTVPTVAPPAADFARHLLLLSRNAIPWSLTGFPAVSLPCGLAGGLPVGLQLVARPWREDLLVALGSRLQAALPPSGFGAGR